MRNGCSVLMTDMDGPPSPITGMYLVRNNMGRYETIGSFKECAAFIESQPSEARNSYEIVPERLIVRWDDMMRLMPDAEVPLHVNTITIIKARQTGERTRIWRDTSKGGYYDRYTQWEAMLGDEVWDMKYRHILAYRRDNDALDNDRDYLIPLELIYIPEWRRPRCPSCD